MFRFPMPRATPARIELRLGVVLASLAFAGAAACGSSSNGIATISDAGAMDSGVSTTRAEDSGNPNSEDSGSTETSLVATFDGKSKTLTRAQYGTTKTDAGKTIIHLEAHEGGDPACPTQSSPTPDRTLVVENVLDPADHSTQGTADGVRAALFDFEGSLLGGTDVLAKATSVKLELDGPAAPEFGMKVTMVFPQGGKLEGHLYATHCASMDE